MYRLYAVFGGGSVDIDSTTAFGVRERKHFIQSSKHAGVFISRCHRSHTKEGMDGCANQTYQLVAHGLFATKVLASQSKLEVPVGNVGISRTL